MNDSFRMRRFQRIGYVNSDFQQIIQRQGLPVDAVLQRRALQQFHGDERRSAVFVDVVNRADIGMIQRRSGLRLAPEAFQRRLVLHHFARQEFQRHLPPQLGILRAINHAHSAAANFLDDAVMRDDLPGRKIRVSHERKL